MPASCSPGSPSLGRGKRGGGEILRPDPIVTQSDIPAIVFANPDTDRGDAISVVGGGIAALRSRWQKHWGQNHWGLRPQTPLCRGGACPRPLVVGPRPQGGYKTLPYVFVCGGFPLLGLSLNVMTEGVGATF